MSSEIAARRLSEYVSGSSYGEPLQSRSCFIQEILDTNDVALLGELTFAAKLERVTFLKFESDNLRPELKKL